MGIAFLLLGLLPLMFLPDMLDSGDEAEDATPETLPIIPLADGDFADDQPDLLDDPETPDPHDDDPTEDDDPTALAPNDEDDLPDDGSQNPDPLDVLAPMIEDDVETPPNDEEDALLPVDQIETDADGIWVNFEDDAGLGYSEIEDFQAGQDVLHIVINPNSIVGDLDLEVLAAANGLDSEVYLEQQLVAVLKGAPDATMADIVVEIGVIAA